MSKKLTLSLVAVAVVIAGVALTSAFEAHIINVTAHIENALSVEPKEIAFGTVFPQEYVEEAFTISLSESFIAEDRVDDVEYKIVQKPKCICEDYLIEGTSEVSGLSGIIVNHWEPGECLLGQYAPVDYATHLCPDGYTKMENLCPFLSKIPVDEDKYGDVPEESYYDKDTNTCRSRATVEEIARGKLAKSEGDESDTWKVDLKVPPVAGFVGQDWPASCAEWVVPSNDIDYGCDLWIEVTNISLPGGNGICAAAPDVMQVLDRSGSIDGTELGQLKTAAHAFVTALDPKELGAWMGQTSFSTYGTLDLPLSYDKTAIDAAIDALVSTSTTNLYEGLLRANEELTLIGPDRTDATSPDFMVVITDGEPNEPGSDSTPRDMAKAQADAADAAGTIIYVVGVGVTTPNADWLKANIATTPGHYFDAGDFDDLQAILEDIATCQPI